MSKDRSGQAAEQAVVAFVDAIEEGVARLLRTDACGQAVSYQVPRALLPGDVREGSWIELRTRLIPPPSDPAALRKKLGQGDDGTDMKL